MGELLLRFTTRQFPAKNTHGAGRTGGVHLISASDWRTPIYVVVIGLQSAPPTLALRMRNTSAVSTKALARGWRTTEFSLKQRDHRVYNEESTVVLRLRPADCIGGWTRQ